MEVRIRRLGTADAPDLSKIARQTFYDTFSGTCTQADMESFLRENYNEKILAGELADDDTFCFFAEIDRAPAAYIQFKEDYKNFPAEKKWKALELKRIYVLNAYQGKGIARQLMDFFLQFALDRKYELVWLGVWEHNTRARRFYYKYGFVDSGYAHDFPIGNTPQTDIWLWKFL